MNLSGCPNVVQEAGRASDARRGGACKRTSPFHREKLFVMTRRIPLYVCPVQLLPAPPWMLSGLWILWLSDSRTSCWRPPDLAGYSEGKQGSYQVDAWQFIQFTCWNPEEQ